MNSGSIKDYFNLLTNTLTALYPHSEAESIAYAAAEYVLNYTKFRLSQHRGDIFPENKILLWKSVEERLLKGEPIQYITGEAEFYGLKFCVNSSVLIPRPETEEMVDSIIKENGKSKLNVIDIGTGSGCIPVSLKHHRKGWEVYATDISSGALKTAKRNALKNNVLINYIKEDIFEPSSFNEKDFFDIIVSNPPYVPYSDKEKLHVNVRDFEPDTALFAPQGEPFKFYRAIADFSLLRLKPGGKIYVEINEKASHEVATVFYEKRLKNIMILKDINNKPRIITAVK